MHECREADRRGQAHGEILAKGVGGRLGDPKPEPAEQGKQGNDYQDAEKSPFLTDGAEQEVGIGVRQIAQLLLAFPESDAEDLPRSDPYQRLLDLVRVE